MHFFQQQKKKMKLSFSTHENKRGNKEKNLSPTLRLSPIWGKATNKIRVK